jgi:hypothetical protein
MVEVAKLIFHRNRRITRSSYRSSPRNSYKKFRPRKQYDKKKAKIREKTRKGLTRL